MSDIQKRLDELQREIKDSLWFIEKSLITIDDKTTWADVADAKNLLDTLTDVINRR